jgi:hypothetical protein
MRPAPAFMEYASDMLVNTSGMSLDERGLLTSMRWRCWTHHEIPRTPELLAPLIGIAADQIQDSLTAKVLGFFTPTKEHSDRLSCPELENYRLEMMAKRESNRKNGAKGGRSTGERLSKAPKRSAVAPPEVKEEELNRKEASREKLGKEENLEYKEWLDDYTKNAAHFALPEK